MLIIFIRPCISTVMPSRQVHSKYNTYIYILTINLYIRKIKDFILFYLILNQDSINTIYRKAQTFFIKIVVISKLELAAMEIVLKMCFFEIRR